MKYLWIALFSIGFSSVSADNCTVDPQYGCKTGYTCVCEIDDMKCNYTCVAADTILDSAVTPETQNNTSRKKP